MFVSYTRAHTIYTIAVIGFIYTLAIVIPMYSNSSFLGLFMNEEVISYVYMLSSAAGILGFLAAPALIRRLGNYATAIILVCIQIALFYGLIAATSALWIGIFFVLQTMVASLIGLCLDIFLEVYTSDGKVGAIRGLYTATLNASWVIAPLIGSMLINGNNNFKSTYIAALAMLFPLIYLIYRNFPRFKDPNYTHLSPWQLVRHISRNSNWVKLFFANTILQVFYSWMVVYSPIYMNKTLGFSWEEIGIILVVMLLPFPLIQYPLGKMTDGRYGEREMMAIGFAITGTATILLSLYSVPSVMIWAVLLFITRIGAAIAEIMIETYFFKTVPTRDTAALGLFRITRPISYFIAPLIMVIGLYVTTNQWMFAVIGVLTLIAVYPSLLIKNVK